MHTRRTRSQTALTPPTGQISHQLSPIALLQDKSEYDCSLYIHVYIAHSNYVYMHKNSTGGFVRYMYACPVCRYSNLLCTIAAGYSLVCVFSENEQFDKLSEVIPVVSVAVVYMYVQLSALKHVQFTCTAYL